MTINRINGKALSINLAVLGLGLGLALAQGQTQRQAPAEHEGVSVVALGEVKPASLKKQIGLEGYRMQLREITVAPGGAIAEHSHANRPGLVKTISGAWTEVRGDKEIFYPASKPEALVEDENTVHWLYNDGTEPAVAIVCGLTKSF